MPLPRHIQQQIDAGNAAHEAFLKGEPVPQAGPPEPEVQFGPYDPPVVREPPPRGAEEEPGAGRAPIGDPPAEPEPEGGSEDDALAKAKHGIATWKGRYKADVDRLKAQVAELTELTNKQFTAIAGLQAQATTPVTRGEVGAPPSNITAVSEPVITREEREQYGEQFSDYMERLARSAVQQQIDDMRASVDGVRGAVERVDKRTQQQVASDFYRDLGRLCPRYAEIDDDPEFAEWLGQLEVFSGDTRKNLLVKACREADSQRAARFFLGFLAEQEATNPRTADPTPANGGIAGGNPVLERMASPGRARQPTSREAPAPERITEAQARTFYTDVTKGRYRNRPQDKAEMARRIEAALLSGNLTLQ